MNEVDSVRVITLVDNNIWKKGLASIWGLSFYVETYKNGKTYPLLMDTAGSFNSLLKNSIELNVDIRNVKSIFISHWHGDHCGDLSHILNLVKGVTPVYVPSYNVEVKRIKKTGAVAKICDRPIEFEEGIMSTGKVTEGLSEHSLLINVKGKGLVVLSGCGHPGIMKILKRAQKVSGINKVHAVIGGFHSVSSEFDGVVLANFLSEMDVKLVSPCHCTGDNARRGLEKILRKRYVRNGSGRIISI